MVHHLKGSCAILQPPPGEDSTGSPQLVAVTLTQGGESLIQGLELGIQAVQGHAVVWAVGWTAAHTNRTGAVDAAGATPCGRLAWGGRGYQGGRTKAGGMAGVGDTMPTVASTDPEGATMGAGWGGGRGPAAGAVAGGRGEVLHLRGQGPLGGGWGLQAAC